MPFSALYTYNLCNVYTIIRLNTGSNAQYVYYISLYNTHMYANAFLAKRVEWASRLCCTFCYIFVHPISPISYNYCVLGGNFTRAVRRRATFTSVSHSVPCIFSLYPVFRAIGTTNYIVRRWFDGRIAPRVSLVQESTHNWPQKASVLVTAVKQTPWFLLS